MSDSNSVYIVSGCRTAIGSFCGAFQDTPAHELGSIVIKEALKRANVPTEAVSEVVMGQTLTAGQGQNPARLASLKAGLPVSVPAYGVNMLCGSGLKAVYLGWQSIKSGDSSVVVVGGQENMTMARHTALLRNGIRLGNGSLEDSMHTDGLIDTNLKIHMGETAEFLAKKYEVTRDVQDKFAVESQNSAETAIVNGYFKKEITPVTVRKARELVEIIEDEYVKKGTTLEKLQRLKPVFANKNDGTVTAGNASGINDGAAALVLASKNYCDKHNLNRTVKIVAFAQAGLEPIEMGLGPSLAVPTVLQKAGWTVDDVDLYELNEAFAVQSHICIEQIGVPKEKVNVTGGAIALGHPIGASGARVLVTLIHNLERLNKTKGVASLCIGGGMGIAIAIERRLEQ